MMLVFGIGLWIGLWIEMWIRMVREGLEGDWDEGFEKVGGGRGREFPENDEDEVWRAIVKLPTSWSLTVVLGADDL